LFLLALWVCLWSGSALWGSTTWLAHDLGHHHYPWRAWVARAWASGEIPLWAPIAHGFPILGDGQAGILYPPNILLYGLLSETMAFNWSIIGHQLLAAWGGWFLARSMGRSMPAAVVAGAAYGFSGFLISHLVYLGMFQVIALAPWLLGCAWRAVGSRWPMWLLTGVLWGFVWLCGHPQMAFYVSYALVVVLLIRLVSMGEHRLMRSWTLALLAVGVGAVIALPQFFASWELSGEGIRAGGLDSMAAGLGALPPEELVNLIFPDVWGHERPADIAMSYHHRSGGYFGRGVSYWETCIYVGIVAFLLACAAGLKRTTWMWWGFVVVGLVLMLGPLTPLFELYRWVPGAAWFRFPVRAGVFLVLAFSQLAALGVDRALARYDRNHQAALKDAARVFGLVGLLWVSILVVWLLIWGFEGFLGDVLGSMAGPDASDTQERVQGILVGLGQSLHPLSVHVLWRMLLLCCVASALLLVAKERILPGTAARIMGGLVLLELFGWGVGYNERTSASEVTERPMSGEVMVGELDLFRTTVLGRRGPVEMQRGLISANQGMLWGLEDVIVPSPLRTLRNEAWLREVGLGLDLVTPQEQVQSFIAHRHLADLSGVQFVLTAQTLKLPDMDRVWQESRHPSLGPGPRVSVYRNRRAMPRAYVVGCTQSVPDGELALAAMVDAEPEQVQGVAVVEGQGLETCEWGRIGEVEVQRSGWGRLDIKTQTERQGWLVIGERLYPGQRVVVDGELTETLPTNYLFQGLPLSAGEHTVVWAYRPLGLQVLVGLSALAWLLGVLALVQTGIASLRRRTEVPS